MRKPTRKNPRMILVFGLITASRRKGVRGLWTHRKGRRRRRNHSVENCRERSHAGNSGQEGGSSLRKVTRKTPRMMANRKKGKRKKEKAKLELENKLSRK